MDRIEEIKDRLSKSSPGDWKFVEKPFYNGIMLRYVEMVDRPYGDCYRQVLADDDYPTLVDDMKFIANSKSDIKYLINLIDELLDEIYEERNICND